MLIFVSSIASSSSHLWLREKHVIASFSCRRTDVSRWRVFSHAVTIGDPSSKLQQPNTTKKAKGLSSYVLMVCSYLTYSMVSRSFYENKMKSLSSESPYHPMVPSHSRGFASARTASTTIQSELHRRHTEMPTRKHHFLLFVAEVPPPFVESFQIF